jgi:hypothetical protein
MGLIGHPITALIVALLIAVASAFGFANDKRFGFGLLVLAGIVLVVAVVEWWRREDWHLQWPVTKARKPAALPLALAHPPPAAPAAILAPPVPEPAPRVIVDRTPEDLTANFKGVTVVQGEDRIARYLGNWMRVSGPVGNVALISPTLATATFADRSMFTYNVVYMKFRDKKWIDRLVLLSLGDRLAVIGKIESVDPQNVNLENCEIEA